MKEVENGCLHYLCFFVTELSYIRPASYDIIPYIHKEGRPHRPEQQSARVRRCGSSIFGRFTYAKPGRVITGMKQPGFHDAGSIL